MPTDPETWCIDRPGSVPLEFDGWLIGEASSRDRPVKIRPGSTERRKPLRPPPRWTEIGIYRTVTDRWVVEVVGRSVVAGEVDKVKATVCDTPECVQDAVRVGDVITTTATTALTEAAEADPRLASVLTERI